MGCKMISAITWTQLELKGLLEDEESHVHFVRAQRHLGLHPFHLTDLNAALREILGFTLNSFDAKLEGIILAYKNPKLLSRMGALVYDACFIHIDIEADFYVFRPQEGDMLKGIVNKKSQDHVGILVHKAFNVAIPRPHDEEDWSGHYVEIGQEVRFTVTCLDFKGRLPYIRGSLNAEDYLQGCKPFEKVPEKTEDPKVKPKITKFSLYNDEDDEEFQEEYDADRQVSIERVVDDSDVEEKVSPRKSKKVKKEERNDGSRVKSKKKRKTEAKPEPSDSDSNFKSISQTSVGDDGICEDAFSPKKLKKLKKEYDVEKVRTKKKKKSKVKSEEISDTEVKPIKAKRRYVSDDSDIEMEFECTGSTSLKAENGKPNIKMEVLTTDSELNVDKAYQKIEPKRKSSLKRIRKKHDIKTEPLGSESDSEVSKPKERKRIKNEPMYEKSSKKKKENDESHGSSTLNESSDKVIKKRRRIKAEILSSD